MQQEFIPKWRTRFHEKGNQFVQHTVQTGHAAGLKIKSTSNVAGLKLRNTGGMALSKIKNTVAPYRTRSVSIPNTPNTLIPGGEQQNDLKRNCAHIMRGRLDDLQNPDIQESFECGVCFEPMTVNMATCVCAQGHWICNECYQTMVHRHQGSTPPTAPPCPLCRDEMCHKNNKKCSRALTMGISGVPDMWWYELPRRID